MTKVDGRFPRGDRRLAVDGIVIGSNESRGHEIPQPSPPNSFSGAQHRAWVDVNSSRRSRPWTTNHCSLPHRPCLSTTPPRCTFLTGLERQHLPLRRRRPLEISHRFARARGDDRVNPPSSRLKLSPHHGTQQTRVAQGPQSLARTSSVSSL